jgi:hypothetical protein
MEPKLNENEKDFTEKPNKNKKMIEKMNRN